MDIANNLWGYSFIATIDFWIKICIYKKYKYHLYVINLVENLKDNIMYIIVCTRNTDDIISVLLCTKYCTVGSKSN